MEIHVNICTSQSNKSLKKKIKKKIWWLRESHLQILMLIANDLLELGGCVKLSAQIQPSHYLQNTRLERNLFILTNFQS